MKTELSNVSECASACRMMKWLPLLLLPLASMAVPAPSYWGYLADVRTEQQLGRESQKARVRRAQWQALGPIEARVDQLKALNHSLRELIPAWQQEVVAHGAIRRAAQDVGFHLDRLQLTEPRAVSSALKGQVVVERTAILTGTGRDLAALQLVETLRAQGWPVALHALDLERASGSASSAHHTLEIGLFHYADAEPFVLQATSENQSTTALEVRLP